MSAEARRHEDAPKKIDERVISEERLSWIEAPEDEESIALAQERVRDVDRRFEIASGAALEWDETRDRLLGAIGGTEIAKTMRGLMPAEPHTPASYQPPKTPLAAARAQVEPSAGQVQAAPPAATPLGTPVVHPVAAPMPLTPPPATPPRHSAAPEPGSILEKDKTRYRLLHAISETGIDVHLAGEIPASHSQLRRFVQTSPESASVPLMPPPASPPRHPEPAASPEPDNIAELDKTRDRLLHAIGGTVVAGHLGGEIPASHAQLRHLVQTSPESASVPLMPVIAAPLHRPVSETSRTIEAASWAAVPQVPSPPQPVAAAESAPADTAPLPATPAQDRSPRITILARSTGEKSHLGAKVALTAKSVGRATTQLSIQFKNWMQKKAAPAVGRLGQSVWQILTGVDDFAHAQPGAPATDGMAQSRLQPQTWIEKWCDPRRNSRLARPPVVAYCWTADTPLPVEIVDISSTGVHLVTEACWPLGGVLSMTLQRTDRTSDTPESWIVIDFRVIRLCNDGVAGAFIPSTQRRSRSIPSRAEDCADSRALKRFVSHLAVAGMP